MSFCVNFSKVNYHHTFSILYQIVIGNVRQEIRAKFPLLLNILFYELFFPSAITEWNKLHCYMSNVDSFEAFKKRVLRFIRP